MKTILASLLMISSASSYSQDLDLPALKKLFLGKKSTIEEFKVGASKVIHSAEDFSGCLMNSVKVQSIIKDAGDKYLVLSKEIYETDGSEACLAVDLKTHSEDTFVFYENKESLSDVLETFDQLAPYFTSVSNEGGFVTIKMEAQSETATVKFDLTQPIFRFRSSYQDKLLAEDTIGSPDVDLDGVDLRDVAFCRKAFGGLDCQKKGDYSYLLN